MVTFAIFTVFMINVFPVLMMIGDTVIVTNDDKYMIMRTTKCKNLAGI